MCLSSVDSVIKDYGTNIGYKYLSVEPYDDTLHFPHKLRGVKIEIGVWMDAWQSPVYADDRNYYKSGFHIYNDSKDAINNRLPGEVAVEVEYDEVICTGEQHKSPVVVANKMRVVKILDE